MRRRARLLLSLIAVCLLAYPGTARAGGLTTVTVWYPTDDPVERVWSRELITRFVALHPEIRVDLTLFRFDDFNATFARSLAHGNPPDLAYITPRRPGIPSAVQRHGLLDLRAAARAGRWSSILRAHLLEEYNRPLQRVGAPSGSVFGVPMVMAGVAVLYNRSLLARLHLMVPQSLAMFRTDLDHAHRAGFTALGIGNEDGWPGTMMFSTVASALASPSSLSAEQSLRSGFTFLSPSYLRAATLLRQWADAGYLTVDLGASDAQEGIDLFFQGHTLFQLISSSQCAQIKKAQSMTGMPVGVFAFPGPREPVMPRSGYLGWVVPAAGKHHRQAIQLIGSALSASTASYLSRLGLQTARPNGGPSARIPAWQVQYSTMLSGAREGAFLEAAPMPNLQSVMQMHVDRLLHSRESARAVISSLQLDYASRGKRGRGSNVSGEF